MSEIEKFKNEVSERIASFSQDDSFQKSSNQWLEESMRKKYVYNFSWMGRPIIQYPQDMVAMQELIWSVQPDLIIETGIAHGGSLILSASMLELNAACGGAQDALVVGVDIDIREHNKEAIESHPMYKRIEMIEGSSIDEETINQVKEYAKDKSKILVILDSNHTHEHVLAELRAYAPLVTKDSYCVVFDTFVEDVPDDVFPDRPWSQNNNPKTAVWSYLEENKDFSIDKTFQNKLLITVAPDGFLKKVK